MVLTCFKLYKKSIYINLFNIKKKNSIINTIETVGWQLTESGDRLASSKWLKLYFCQNDYLLIELRLFVAFSSNRKRFIFQLKLLKILFIFISSLFRVTGIHGEILIKHFDLRHNVWTIARASWEYSTDLYVFIRDQ